MAILNVTDYGAVGDGVTDNYTPLRNAAAALALAPAGSTLVFPKGVYYVDRYRIIAGPSANGVQNIRFDGCHGAIFEGNGSTLSMKGDFVREEDAIVEGYPVSYNEGVIPFEILNSNNWTLRNFNLTGNVDQMTRLDNVVEGYNAGISTNNCKEYRIENCRVYGFHTDGIMIGHGAVLADEDPYLLNVDSYNNARQGISVLQAVRFLADHCKFRNTGRTGQYGMHSPGAGADVEPVRTVPDVNLKTTDIVFRNCEFSNNIGPQFTANWPERTGKVTVQDSKVVARATDLEQVTFINIANEAITERCKFYIGAGKATLLGPISSGKSTFITSVLFNDNDFFLTDRTGIYYPDYVTPTVFTNNRVNYVGNTTLTGYTLFQNISTISNNRFFSSKLNWNPSDDPYVVAYTGVTTVSGNTYITDMDTNQYKTVYYGPGMTVSGEVFPNPDRFGPMTIPE